MFIGTTRGAYPTDSFSWIVAFDDIRKVRRLAMSGELGGIANETYRWKRRVTKDEFVEKGAELVRLSEQLVGGDTADEAQECGSRTWN